MSVGSVMGLAGVAGAVVMNQLNLNWVFGILACIIAGAVSMEEGTWPEYDENIHVIHRDMRDYCNSRLNHIGGI